ncbi:plasmid pRiA4b ORF-3 family protein [Candidatus Sumerlaeota bacterium]|nr:plasmid pRiA4b ORF-3 family protein [Candidatus Sumerlaeota bacterium]
MSAEKKPQIIKLDFAGSDYDRLAEVFAQKHDALKRALTQHAPEIHAACDEFLEAARQYTLRMSHEDMLHKEALRIAIALPSLLEWAAAALTESQRDKLYCITASFITGEAVDFNNLPNGAFSFFGGAPNIDDDIALKDEGHEEIDLMQEPSLEDWISCYEDQERTIYQRMLGFRAIDLQGKPSAVESVCQLRVTMLDCDPAVWRVALVPATITLRQLHWTITALFGWIGLSDFEFNHAGKAYLPLVPDEEAGADEHDAAKFRLCDLLANPKDKMNYCYNMDVQWWFSVKLDKALPPEPGLAYPHCARGKLAAPPEECDSASLFQMLRQEFLASSGHKPGKHAIGMLGAHFDPELFNKDAINQALVPLQAVWQTPSYNH